MALDLSKVGHTTAPVRFDYDHAATILYGLGIGARAPELDFLYEGRGPKVYPTFSVIPAYRGLESSMADAGISFDNVVHGHQKIKLHRALPPRATLLTTATLAGIYDLKKMAQVVVTTHTTDAAGTALFDTEWGIIVFGEGGFGGEAAPSRLSSPPDRAPDFRVEQSTSPEQALLYRLNGDHNPLHADPEFHLVKERFGRPILHGLCSYGFVARALAEALAGGDATRITEFSARFSKPVWPGDTLITEGWVDGARVWSRTSTRERGEVVLSHCTATLAG
ncbi:MAG: MaoC family dehydratase N-terminal domain-containing protein [Myxococcales bacterium]|nr:MaoC family dehydratase N-terminal domain-containing protein [Myxococcales bacterium]